MTGNELRILQDWQNERHKETMERFDRLERMQSEQNQKIAALQAVQFTEAERDTVRAAVRTVRWLTPRRAAGVGGASLFGAIVVVIDQFRDYLR